MEFTTANPFIPKASVVRYHNGTFEARIHLPGAAAHIDVVPHDNYILVTGSLTARARIDSDGKPSVHVYTDQPCGVFGRDIPVNLTAGTELVVLSAHQDCDDYVVRYTIRNSITPRANCADIANATAGVAGASGSAGCKCPPGMKGTCGGASGYPLGPGPFVGPGLARPTASCGIPPAILDRSHRYGYGYGPYHAHTGYNSHLYGAGYPHHGYTHGQVFHPNGGATF